MSTVEEHPPWCNPTRCKVHELGPHESSPARVTAGRGHGKPPRILLVLWAPPKGKPVKIRLVVLGDLLVNSLDLDLESAAMLAARLTGMISQAEQPNG